MPLDIRYGDLDPNRGAILYIQNDIPVDRDRKSIRRNSRYIGVLSNAP